MINLIAPYTSENLVWFELWISKPHAEPQQMCFFNVYETKKTETGCNLVWNDNIAFV